MSEEAQAARSGPRSAAANSSHLLFSLRSNADRPLALVSRPNADRPLALVSGKE